MHIHNTLYRHSLAPLSSSRRREPRHWVADIGDQFLSFFRLRDSFSLLSQQSFTSYTTLQDPSALASPTGGTYANGVSGNEVVGYYLDGALQSHGFIYNGSSYVTLDYPGASNTYAYGISGSNIVGYYQTGKNSAFQGFRYNGVTYTALNDPLAGSLQGTEVTGISGTIIVGSYFDSANEEHGFVYNGSTYTSLDDPAAIAGGTVVSGISGNNIVGFFDGKDGVTHGFIYDGSTYTTLDDPSGVTYALGVSGDTVVGYFGTSNNAQGFVVTVPEPAALNSMLLCFCLLQRRHRR